MTSSSSPCAHMVAHRLTTRFRATIFCPRSASRIFPGLFRAVVAFTAHNVATILLVGPHDDKDPFMDVYSQLYELAGLAETPTAERTKPPCCAEKDGKPPVPDSELLADLVGRARQLSGAAKRRVRKAVR